MFLGVVGLAALFLVVGWCILFGAYGWATVRGALADAGLAFMLGFAAMGVLGSFALVVGLGISMWTILALALVVGVAGIAVGLRLGHAWPQRHGLRISRPQTLEQLVTLVAAAVSVVLALLLYRAFRHQPLLAYDAWNFWLPKAKTILDFGGIDNALFKSLPAPSYPLLVPTVDSMLFRFIGGTDTTALAQFYWFALIGLVGAVVALLRPLTRSSVVWIFVALFLVLPQVELRWFQLLGDWTLDSFFVISALLLVRWIRFREPWLLAVLPIPLAALLVTKREGQLLAGCLVVGALAATWRERRAAFPRILGAVVIGFAISQLPWRIWWTSRHLPSDLHEGGIGHSGSLHRAAASARVVLDLMFSRGMWELTLPLALVACAAVLLRRGADRRPVVLFLTTTVLLFLGFAWVMWSDPLMPLNANPALNPIPREVASTSLLALVLTPVFVGGVLADELPAIFALRPLAAARLGVARAHAALVAARPRDVVAGLIVAQWLVVLAVAAAVRHNGWLFYQGGDQLWYYTTGWLLAHGHYPQPGIGFLWPILLAPISLVTGPNAANALPAVIVLQFVILLPISIAAIYGIGRQIGGRLFGYWTASLWILVPLIGIKFTDAGYHQRYTEALLPQAFGLTGMADLPTTVAALVSGYFCVRVLAARTAWTLDAVAAGVAAGAAVAIKPATALFLAGPVLAFAVARRPRAAALFAAGLAPALLALAFIKWRGFGYVPLFHSAAGVYLAAEAAVPLAATGFGHYLHFDWHVFTGQLDQVREHFWSVRVVEWLVVGGSIAVLIRSRRYGALVLGWFAAVVLVKTGSGRGGIEGGNLLRLLMPSYPAFIVMLASLPFLVPGVARRLPEPEPAAAAVGPRTRLTLVVAGVLITCVIPIAAWAAASPVRGPSPEAAILQQPPIPARVDLGASARRTPGGVAVRWRPVDVAAGPVFYHVFRAPAASSAILCGDRIGTSADYCWFQLTDLGTTRSPTFVDRSPPKGSAAYYVGVAANWIDDTSQGDVYEMSTPVTVR